jgi:hypothetical protein
VNKLRCELRIEQAGNFDIEKVLDPFVIEFPVVANGPWAWGLEELF